VVSFYVNRAGNTSKITPVAHSLVDPYVDLHHFTGRQRRVRLLVLAPGSRS